MIELGRRNFITGLVALVAAPAVIRVAPLMPISTRFTPVFVPIDWLAWKYGMKPFPVASELREHGWSRPMADNWIDLNDHDPEFVKKWAELQPETDWFRGYN